VGGADGEAGGGITELSQEAGVVIERAFDEAEGGR